MASDQQARRFCLHAPADRDVSDVRLVKTGASSTDANFPMSIRIPAITIDGGGTGTGAHSLGETYDDGPSGWLGPQWAALIVAALAGVH